MSGHSNSMAEDDSVWQGYVSAIACLLLALLLLMSILALAIVLGGTAGQDEPGTAGVALRSEKAPVLSVVQPKPAGLAPQWVLRFPTDTLRFTDKQREDLAGQFAAANAAGQSDWRAWVQMPTEASSSREAYLRLLAVRNLLVAAGIKPEQIDLRILSEAAPANSAVEANDAIVLLAKIGKPSTPTALTTPAKTLSTPGEVR